MMWRLLGPGGPQDYWRHAEWDELGNTARFSVDEKFRGEAYKKMTKIFLEHFPWLPIIQPYEDYGLQKYVEWTPDPLQQLEIRPLQLQVPPGLIPASHFALSPVSGRGEGEGVAHAGLPSLPGSRAGRALVALWLVSTVVFVVMRLSGDPTPLLLPPDAPQSEIFRLRKELGLDRSLPVQYAVFLGNLVRGDFGQSIRFKSRRSRVVTEHLPATLELGLTSFGLAILIAIPIGLLSAVYRNTMLDHAAMGLALVGQSAPTFFLGILFILLISVNAGLLPTSGRGDWQPPRAAGGDPGALRDGLHRPDHPLGDARGPARRLHPDRAGQGTGRDPRHRQAHAEERRHPHRHHHRAQVRRSPRAAPW